jgi:hypothetical protein
MTGTSFYVLDSIRSPRAIMATRGKNSLRTFGGVHNSDVMRELPFCCYRMKLILPCGRSASLSRIALRSRIFSCVPKRQSL